MLGSKTRSTQIQDRVLRRQDQHPCGVSAGETHESMICTVSRWAAAPAGRVWHSLCDRRITPGHLGLDQDLGLPSTAVTRRQGSGNLSVCANAKGTDCSEGETKAGYGVLFTGFDFPKPLWIMRTS